MVNAGKRMKMLAVAAAAIMAMVAAVIAVQPDEEVSAVGTSSSPASSLYMDVVEFGIDTTGLSLLDGVSSTVTTHYLYVGSSVTIYSWTPGDSYGYCVYGVSSGYGLTASNGYLSGTITKAGTITFTSGSFLDTELSSMSNSMSKIVAVAEEEPDIPVSSISLSMTTTTTGFKVTATTSPSNASYSSVAFSVSSSTSFDPVYSTSGKTLTVTPSVNCTYTITCGAKDGYGASNTMTVYVSELVFNANGGSGAPSTQFVYSTSNTTHSHVIPSTTPTHSVNTFAGWATSSTGSAVYDPGDTVSISASGWKTLYAAWITPTEISITPSSAGETMTLTANVTSYYSDKSVTWSTKQYTGSVRILSTTSNTATVGDADGGYCTVTATANDGTGTTATITLYGTSILFLSYAESTNPAALKWVSTTSESHVFTLPDTSSLKKSGYIFSGWATSSGSDTVTYIDGDTVSVSGGTYKYLYGVWVPEPVICTISFKSNGGEGEIADQRVQAGNSIMLPTRGYTKVGAILAYWGLSETGAAGTYEIGETYEVTDDVTFYAIYIEKTSFSDTRAPTSVEAGETYSYTPFSGNPSGDPIYSSYSVFWAVTNGSFSFVIDECPSWMEIEWDMGITVTGTPIAEDKGVHHVAFHIEETGVTNSELLEKVVASPIDWYVAVTVPEPELFTVTFNANGGEGQQQSFESVLDGNAVTLPGGSDLGFSKTGYTQIGWSTFDGSNNIIIYSLGSGFTVTSDTIFRAEWQADANLVIYDANGGISSTKQYDIANTDGTVSLPSNGLIKSGARFGGWYLGSVSDGIYAPGMEISVTGQMHLMAYWIPTGSTICTVTFNANGGNGSLKVDLVKGHSCILPDIGFTSDGDLIGWSITSTGEDALLPLTLFSPESTQTLYAVYSVTTEDDVRFTIVFSTNGGSGSYSPVKVFAGETIEKPTRIPTLAAHVFTGWKVEGGGMWDFNDPVEGSMTLSAMWAQHFTIETDGLTVMVIMAGEYAGMNTHIDWGDGESQDTNSAQVTHTYARPMTGTITVFSNGLNSEESSSTAFYVSADSVELKAVGTVEKDRNEWVLDATDSTGFSSLVWYVDGERVGDSVTVRVSLSDGTHDIVLTVFDNDNNTKDWTTQITVGEDSAEDHTIAYVVILLSAIIGILATARMGPQGLLIIVIGGLVGFFMM